jgi:hypothetical protein
MLHPIFLLTKAKGRNLMFAYANTSLSDYSTHEPLDIQSTLMLYMEPLLQKNNFIFSHGENSTYIFRHKKAPELSIAFTVKPDHKCIRCDLTRGNKNDLMATYPISLFVQGNSCFKGTKNEGFWYYHSDEELIAILEEQAELLAQFGFEWIFDHLNMEMDEC